MLPMGGGGGQAEALQRQVASTGRGQHAAQVARWQAS
jgi:hypothetical protein